MKTFNRLIITASLLGFITGITNLAKVQGIVDGKDTVFAKRVINSDTCF